MKKALLCLFLLPLIFSGAFAQDRTVTGKVTGEDSGESIPGVNVILKGTTVGTVTDVDGNYTINVPSDGGILQFSFIGLATKEVQIGNRSVVNVDMSSDVKQLGEVVVTAVGIEREKKALGYSVENVDGEAVQLVSEPDPLRALQGKVAGVNLTATSGAPGSSTRITIRGNSSLLGNNQPLFVVDGVPYNNDFVTSGGVNPTTGGLTGGGAFGSRISDLDPNNIASITVLKGAAAAALYGTRAANGVVLITTKTGSSRVSRKGLEISLNSSYSFETIGNIPEYQNSYGTGTNFTYAQANGSWGAPFVGATPYASRDSIPHWYQGRDGWGGLYDGVQVPYRAYPDNVEDFFNTGKVFENSISISGGNESSTLTATISHLNQDGFVPTTEFTRTNLSLGGRTVLENGFTVGGSLAYTRNGQNGVISGVGNLGGQNPSTFARLLYLGRNWDLHGQPYINPTDNGSEFMVGRGQANNPYWSVENSGIFSETDRYVATTDIGYDVFDWLNVSNKFGINGYSTLTSEWQRPGSTNTEVGEYQELNVTQTEINNDFIISATPDLGEDFTLRALVGHNVNQRTLDVQSIAGTEYVIFDIEDLDNMNSVVPNGGDYERRRLVGVYGDFSFGYRDWAFLTLTGRNDWSSTLPQENNSFFYPAVAASAVISEALGIQSDFLNFLKLRAGWSQVGNDTDPYQLTPVFLVNDFREPNDNTTAQKPFRGVPGMTLTNIARDPNLLPERTTEVEFGFEARLIDNKIGLDVTYYKRNSTDQIAQISLADETGFSSFLTNFGEVSNEGVELTLDLTPVQTSNFNWNIVGTFTHNKNVIEELTEGLDIVTFGSFFSGNARSVHLPDQEFGLLYGSISARDDEGNLLIDPSNGQLLTTLQPAVVGNPNPDFIMGINNSFSFKGITLGAVFDWKQGGDIFSNSVSSALGRGVLGFQAEREMNYVIPGVYGDPNTLEPIRNEAGEKIPNSKMIDMNSLFFGNTFASNGNNEWAVWDGTTYRLRQVTLSYDLPKGLLENTPIGSARLSFSGRNLWFWAPNFPGDMNYDPETSQFGARNVQGIEFSTTPSARRYGVNLRVTF